MDLLSVVQLFDIIGQPISVVPYGNGHTNDTYKVTVEGGDEKHYILQKINPFVFNSIPQLMSNIKNVTEWLQREEARENGDTKRDLLRIIYTKKGESFAAVDGDSYRMYNFIENTVSLEKPRTAYDFSESSVAYAKFLKRLTMFDAGKLYVTIPNLHNTPRRLHSLNLAVQNDKSDRLKYVGEDLKWVDAREGFAARITTLLSVRAVPMRVTHNDMALNNVLLDEKTGDGVAVIDLDTVMPGSLLYDFGDAIRFGCNTNRQNDPDIGNVHFNVGMYKVYTQTFLANMENYITPLEKKHLLYSAALMTFECGVRFLTDYLNGDLYYNTSYDAENLDRAHTQFKLVERIEEVYDELSEWTFNQ